MSESMIDPAFRVGQMEAAWSPDRGDPGTTNAPRRPSTDRIRIVNAVQSTVGAYLSPAQIEDVATAVVSALRLEA